MSLARHDRARGQEPEQVTCPACQAQPGQDCTFAMFAAPPRAVHPARYAALDRAAALAATQATETAR